VSRTNISMNVRAIITTEINCGPTLFCFVGLARPNSRFFYRECDPMLPVDFFFSQSAHGYIAGYMERGLQEVCFQLS